MRYRHCSILARTRKHPHQARILPVVNGVTIPLLSTAAIVGVGLVLLGLRWWLRRPGASIAIVILIMATLIGLVWIPPDWRTTGFIGAGALLGLAGAGGAERFWAAVIFGGILWLTETLVPGGTSALILGVLAIVGYVRTRSSVLHLVRLTRAGNLAPNETPDREVELAGTVAGPDRPIDGLDERAAAWKLDQLCTDYIVIETELGPVFAETATAEVDGEVITLTKEQRKALLDAEGARPEPRMKQLPKDVELQVFRAGSPAYVVGIPQWEPPPRGSTGYRDSPVVPVFRQRTSAAPPVYIANRSEQELRRESWWTLSTWAGWGLACGWVGAAQALFDL